MYLSFVNDEKEKLQERIEKLDSLAYEIENECDAIAEELGSQMRNMISDVISRVFEEFEITDNYYNEREQEVQEAMQEYVEREFC